MPFLASVGGKTARVPGEQGSARLSSPGQNQSSTKQASKNGDIEKVISS